MRPTIPRHPLVALALALAIVGIWLAAPRGSIGATPPLGVTFSQAAVSLDPLANRETVSVSATPSDVSVPYHYVFTVRGITITSGDTSLPTVTVSLLDNCSVTSQSVSVTISDASSQVATTAGMLDRSLCPPPPTVAHAGDHILAGPTITGASFVDHLRLVGSPALASGATIYNTLIAGGVNPAFALGTFQAESSSGTRGYAVTTLNWGNMLYYSWQAPYGAVPYAPGNGYTYAKFPSWAAGVRAYAALLGFYDQAGYVTVSEASAHWLGTPEGSPRHLIYLSNITNVMSSLPDDAVPKMTMLAAPGAARGTFAAAWAGTDNIAVTDYQVRIALNGGVATVSDAGASVTRVFSLASGRWVIGVRAGDAAGNWSGWRQVAVAVDADAPAMSALSAPTIVHSIDGLFGATWNAVDNVGVTGYQTRFKNGQTGSWSAASGTTARTRTFHLAAGTWYIDVRARDAVGNLSAWRETSVIVPTDDRSFAFSSGNTRLLGSLDFRSTATSTRRVGATMTSTFSGTSFYLIGRAAPTDGRLRLTIDGVAHIIDTGFYRGVRATAVHYRAVLYGTRLSAGPHVVTITDLATAGRPTIVLDALGWHD
jgi:hypothetical protein